MKRMLSRSQNKRPLDHIQPSQAMERPHPLYQRALPLRRLRVGRKDPVGAKWGSAMWGGQLLQEETGSPCCGLASAYAELPEAIDYFNQAQFVFERDVLKSKRA